MTPRHRLSQHSMDVIFKLEARQLGAALARRFGINLPRVVRHFPTEVPVADVHLEQLDSVFELADGGLLHLEFQTEYRRETLARFLLYDAYLYERHGRPIYTVVIYGAGVMVAADTVEGGWLYYRVENVLLGQEDGEAALARLEARVVRGAGLSSEERLDLIFLPLMRHRRPRAEVVRAAVELAEQLPAGQQRQTLASLIGLGHRFLGGDELETLLEGLMSTTIGQQLIERGYEQGLERGVAQERRQVTLRVLTNRFGDLPPDLGARLAQISDLGRLEALLDQALTASTLAEFMAALE